MLRAATGRYLRGKRIDVQAIAAELGLGRTTIYRWFGSREGLIGAVLVRAAEGAWNEARESARGRGAGKILDTFDRYNHIIAEAPALRRFVEREREAAVRVVTAPAGGIRPRMVEIVSSVIKDEVEAGAYDPPLDPETLAYAVVRLGEAFIFNEEETGLRDSVDRLREVEAAVLGMRQERPRKRRD